jgi:hypothetical protein
LGYHRLAGVESVVVLLGAALAEALVEALAQVWALELLLGTALELVTKLAQVSS